MTLTQYLLPLRRQWYLIVLIAAVTMAGVAAYTFTRVPMYSATTELYVTVSQTDADIQQLQQGSTLAQEKVKTYSQIVTVNDLMRKVIDKLSLPYSVGQLRGAIDVTSPVDTTLIDIKVVDATPQRAAAIANAIADELPNIIYPIETPAGRTTSPVTISQIQSAQPPGAAYSPHVNLNLMIGLLLGIGLGGTAAFIRDQLNTTLKSMADVESITGAVPLGVTPFDKTTESRPLADARDASGRAEAFRILRTNLQFTNVDSPPRVVVVTSSLPNEGKSTTACNLAVTLALGGARTCIIDGDLRKPSLTRYLGISAAVGVTNVLAGQYHLKDALVPMLRGKLAVLPSGPIPPNPSELLHSTQMQRIITTLSERFDYVVIDAPPVLSVTDASLLAVIADGVLLVIKHGKTKREELSRSLQALTIVNAKILGTVMNFVPARRGKAEEYAHGYYGRPPDPGDDRRNASTISADAVPRPGDQQLPTPATVTQQIPTLRAPRADSVQSPGEAPGLTEVVAQRAETERS